MRTTPETCGLDSSRDPPLNGEANESRDLRRVCSRCISQSLHTDATRSWHEQSLRLRTSDLIELTYARLADLAQD